MPVNKKNKLSQDILNVVDFLLQKDPAKFINFLFYIRDKKKGLGLRKIFCELFISFSKVYPRAYELLNLIPDYGSWKDLVYIAEEDISLLPFISVIFAEQLKKDSNSENGKISTASKWLPFGRKNTRNNLLTQEVKKILNLNDSELRKKYITPLRKKLDLVETKLSQGKYDKIKYVSSIAGKRLVSTFQRHEINIPNNFKPDPISLIEYSLKHPNIDINQNWNGLFRDFKEFKNVKPKTIIYDSSVKNKDLLILLTLVFGNKIIFDDNKSPIHLDKSNISNCINIISEINSSFSNTFTKNNEYDDYILSLSSILDVNKEDEILLLTNKNIEEISSTNIRNINIDKIIFPRSLNVKNIVTKFYKKILTCINKNEDLNYIIVKFFNDEINNTLPYGRVTA